MTVAEFLSRQAPERKETLLAINDIIINEDNNINAEVGKMMGQEMILYKASGVFKYGLSSVKSHMSLHLMPIYGDSKLHSEYKKLLTKAKFQKGCINFKKENEMPLNIIRDLLKDCAKVDLIEMMKNAKRNKELKYF